MNILHILSSDDKYGSAQCFLELLDYEKHDFRVKPIVVTPKYNDINRTCDELGVKNYVVDYAQMQIPKHDSLLLFLLKYIYHTFLYYRKKNRAKKLILQIVVENHIAVIHTNSSVIDIGSVVAKQAGICNVWHLREFGKLDFNFFAANPFYLMQMNEEQNVFLSISEMVTQNWIERGLKQEKITTIYDGVNAKRFVLSEKSTQADKKIRLVMCGSFCEAKNQKLLVEAIGALGDREQEKLLLDFYGKTEGSYFEETKELVNQYGLNDIIRFKGYTENIPQELAKYDVGIICSRAEAFGRVTVEYMMASLCTVASSAGANLEIVEEQCGILYKEGSAQALAKVIENIVNDRVDYSNYGKRARTIAIEKYDINKNAEKIVGLFLANI